MIVKIIIEIGLIQNLSYYQAHNNKNKFSNLLKRNKEDRNFISTITEVNYFNSIDITKYTQIIDNNLIQYKLEERLAKRSGFSYFLSSY